MDSGYFNPGWIAGMLVGIAVAMLVGIAVGGMLLRLAVSWVAKFAPGYLRCCGVVALAGLVTMVLNVGFAMGIRWLAGATGLYAGMNATGLVLQGIGALLGIAVNVGVIAGLVLALIPAPDGTRLGFARAVAIAGICVAMGIALYAVVAGALLLLLGGVPGVSR